MRFMMIVLPKCERSDAPEMPSAEVLAKSLEYKKSLQKAGVLLAVEGLYPPATGVRITPSADGKPVVTDGPFTEAKEFIGGYWIIQVRSREEAMEWAKRVPMVSGHVLEVRQIYDMPDVEQ